MKSTKFLSSFIILFSLFSCSLEINKTTNVPLDVTSIFTAVRKTTHDQTSPIKLVATLTVENKYSDSQSIENVNSQDELNNQVIEFKNIPL